MGWLKSVIFWVMFLPAGIMVVSFILVCLAIGAIWDWGFPDEKTAKI